MCINRGLESQHVHIIIHVGLTGGTQLPSGPDSKDEELKKQIETEKAKYVYNCMCARRAIHR